MWQHAADVCARRRAQFDAARRAPRRPREPGCSIASQLLSPPAPVAAQIGTVAGEVGAIAIDLMLERADIGRLAPFLAFCASCLKEAAVTLRPIHAPLGCAQFAALIAQAREISVQARTVPLDVPPIGSGVCIIRICCRDRGQRHSSRHYRHRNRFHGTLPSGARHVRNDVSGSMRVSL
jgi:hypothetical protein